MARIDGQAYAVLHVSDSESALVVAAETINDLSSETRLPPGVAWPLLATARVVWHDAATDSRVHSCELCASARVSFYDTGIRLPTVERYSAAV